MVLTFWYYELYEDKWQQQEQQQQQRRQAITCLLLVLPGETDISRLSISWSNLFILFCISAIIARLIFPIKIQPKLFRSHTWNSNRKRNKIIDNIKHYSYSGYQM